MWQLVQGDRGDRQHAVLDTLTEDRLKEVIVPSPCVSGTGSGCPLLGVCWAGSRMKMATTTTILSSRALEGSRLEFSRYVCPARETLCFKCTPRIHLCWRQQILGTPWDLLADSIMKNPKSIFQATVGGIYDHLVAEQRRAQEDLLNLCLWIITGHEFEKGNRVIFGLHSLSLSLR